MKAFCDICWDQLDEIKEVATTICGHIFHEKCINTWVKQSQSCPSCRSPIEKGQIIKLYFSICPAGIPDERRRMDAAEAEVNHLTESFQAQIRNLEVKCKMNENLNNIKLRHMELQHRIKDSRIKHLKAIKTEYDRLLSLKIDHWHLCCHQRHFELKILQIHQKTTVASKIRSTSDSVESPKTVNVIVNCKFFKMLLKWNLRKPVSVTVIQSQTVSRKFIRYTWQKMKLTTDSKFFWSTWKFTIINIPSLFRNLHSWWWSKLT